MTSILSAGELLGTLARLYWEFFKTGLFAVGGGLATLPFLKDIGAKTGWYTYSDLMNMLAVSESTPGPIGVNMATYVGFTAAGVPGALAATVGEVTPSVIVVVLVAMFLRSFRNSATVERAFYGLRPASTALIGAACAEVALEVLTGFRLTGSGLVNTVTLSGDSLILPSRVLLAALLLALTHAVPKVKDLHPAAFIAFAAAVGVVFRFAGA